MSENELTFKYPSRLPLRIDWSELDLFGHVNNVAYLKYVQASRVNYWEMIGLTRLYDDERIGPMLVSTSCQFKKQLHYPGNITLMASIEFIKNTSFGIRHQIVNEKAEVCAEAQDVIIMFDFDKQQKIAFPESFRKKAAALEEREL
jgi:acyl-CoA thioester hydrolase